MDLAPPPLDGDGGGGESVFTAMVAAPTASWDADARAFFELDTLVADHYDRERRQSRRVPGDSEHHWDDEGDDPGAETRLTDDGVLPGVVDARIRGDPDALPLLLMLPTPVAADLGQGSSVVRVFFPGGGGGLAHQDAIRREMPAMLRTVAESCHEEHLACLVAFVRHMTMIDRFTRLLVPPLEEETLRLFEAVLGVNDDQYVSMVNHARADAESRRGFLHALRTRLQLHGVTVFDTDLSTLEAYEDRSPARLIADVTAQRVLPSFYNPRELPRQVLAVLPAATRCLLHRFALDVLADRSSPVTLADAIEAHMVVLANWSVMDLVLGSWTFH